MADYSARHISFSDDEGSDRWGIVDKEDDFGIDILAENLAHHVEVMSEPGDYRAFMAIPEDKKELLSGRCDSCSSMGYGNLVPERCPDPQPCKRWDGRQARSKQSVYEMAEDTHCILCRPVRIAVVEKIQAAWPGRELTSSEIKLNGPFYQDPRVYGAMDVVPQTFTPVPEIGGKREIKCKFMVEFYVDGRRDGQNKILVPLKLYYRSALGDLRRLTPTPPHKTRPGTEIHFIALSYLCAATAQEYCRKLSVANALSFEEPGALKRQDYPRLIWDAMVLCGDLGERYLWVDCLCIIQDDKEEKLRQIQAMDRIYSCAKFTMAVAADWHRDVGIPGIRNRLRNTWWEEELFWGKYRPILDFSLTTDVMDSPWNYRGWTYQEQCLSRRKIFISNHRSFFACQEMEFQENRGRRVSDHGDVNVLDVPPTMWLECWNDYMVSIQDYTARNLTFDTDILHAFAGYSRVAAMQLNTRMIYGMPERWISRALRFEHNKSWKRREGTEDIPSWSWAAWCGMANFRVAMPYLDHAVYGCLVVFHYSDPVEGLVKLQDEDWWFWDEDFPECNQPCKWVIEPSDPKHNWPTRPSYDWRECPHNRDTLSDHVEIHRKERMIAASHPKSLVFNTTIANLLLKTKITVPAGFNPTQDVTIHDKSGRMVGILDKDVLTPVPDWVKTTNPYEIIVIGAGVLAPTIRWPRFHEDQLPGKVRSLWFEPPTGERESPWVLFVMLVKRRNDDQNVVERLGTGFVLMEFWKDCEPTRETIVLV
ncbi:hypothetical protein CBER1_11567 [Cercospora berteroae]|uniref:Heterokaryon incompatibility domain-containing protein n=1 Tax=Cercospora berteroae TaxID=357750 RepID=A0A2S6BZM3_9PEZI|nr:hypothetical protein CBER1_11567 [Cercospora berteroae]